MASARPLQMDSVLLRPIRGLEAALRRDEKARHDFERETLRLNRVGRDLRISSDECEIFLYGIDEPAP